MRVRITIKHKMKQEVNDNNNANVDESNDMQFLPAMHLQNHLI